MTCSVVRHIGITGSIAWTPAAIPARRSGWERALVAELERHMALPFAWGRSDCLTMAADVCLAMTGVDPFPAGLRGSYGDEAAAMALLSRLGLESPLRALQTAFTAIPKARARRGDCGVLVRDVDGRREVATLIVAAGGMALGKSPLGGPAAVPVLTLHKTFAIGAR